MRFGREREFNFAITSLGDDHYSASHDFKILYRSQSVIPKKEMNKLHANCLQGKNYIKSKSSYFKNDIMRAENANKQNDKPIEVGTEIIEAVLEMQ